MKTPSKLTRRLCIGFLFLAVFYVGMIVGERRSLPSESVTDVYNKDLGAPTDVDFEPFWEVWNLINEKYADTGTSTPSQDKVWGAIEGLANSLGDPYTVFLPPEEAKEFEEMIGGSFGGVGMEIGKENDIITVIAPLKGTPAEMAGIRAGDMILEIDGKTTGDLSVDEAVGLIRGEPGTVVKLTTLRESADAPEVISITRAEIVIPTLDTEMRSDGVFVISLYNFDANATNAFYGAMKEFVQSGSTKLLVDLRGNPGGYLDAAVDIASYFLPAGDIVVRESFDGGVEESVHRSKGYSLLKTPVTLAVLVDRGSASASEILAGALRENGKATLIGERTFGKGSVQELVPVTDDTALKLTIAQWLTPEGLSISEAGLTPDIEVVRTEEDILAEQDPPFDRAVRFLLTGL